MHLTLFIRSFYCATYLGLVLYDVVYLCGWNVFFICMRSLLEKWDFTLVLGGFLHQFCNRCWCWWCRKCTYYIIYKHNRCDKTLKKSKI